MPRAFLAARLPAGVIVTSLAAALHEHPELDRAAFGALRAFRDHAFTALNTAFLRDGAFLVRSGREIRRRTDSPALRGHDGRERDRRVTPAT